MKNLVIVESGAKATKITGFLNKNFPKDEWRVEACLGHIRDLPDEETAVNPEDWTDFKWKETQVSILVYQYSCIVIGIYILKCKETQSIHISIPICTYSDRYNMMTN